MVICCKCVALALNCKVLDALRSVVKHCLSQVKTLHNTKKYWMVSLILGETERSLFTLLLNHNKFEKRTFFLHIYNYRE